MNRITTIILATCLSFSGFAQTETHTNQTFNSSLHVNGTTNQIDSLIIDNCIFENILGYGIEFKNLYYVEIKNSVFKHISNGAIKGAGVDIVSIHNNAIDSISSFAIQIPSANIRTGLVNINDNTISNIDNVNAQTGTGIKISHTDSVFITNNNISYCQWSGIALGNYSNPSHDIKSLLIESNNISYTLSDGINSQENIKESKVLNNEISYIAYDGIGGRPNHGDHGVYWQAPEGVIEGNKVHDNFDGVDCLEGGCKGVGISVRTSAKVLRNEVYNCSGNGIGYYNDHPTGIEPLLIANNIVFDNDLNGIYVSGTKVNIIDPQSVSRPDSVLIYNNTVTNLLVQTQDQWHRSCPIAINTMNNYQSVCGNILVFEDYPDTSEVFWNDNTTTIENYQHNIQANSDIGFVDFSNRNFNLTNTAISAIDIIPNTQSYVVNDFYNNLRVESHDVGAVEFGLINSIYENGKDINLNIFPNPLGKENVLRVEIEKEFNQGVISIFNLNGNLLMQKQIVNSSTIFDLTNFNSGIYILSVELKGKIFYRKVIKSW